MAEQEITYCTADCGRTDCHMQLDQAPLDVIPRWGYQPAGCPGHIAMPAGHFDAGPHGGGDIYAPDEGGGHGQ